MGWSEILGHQPAKERFVQSLSRNRLASTYLFVGPDGIGKRTFALQLAKGLLCESHDSIESCDQCPTCQQIDAQTHPDLIQVSRPAGKAFIPVELFIGPKEKRHRQGLCHDIGLKPFSGNRKVAIIDDADFLNVEGANCLLKTLEEPPANSLLILIGTSEQQQLPTILSRSQVVRFSALTVDDVRTVLGRIALETEADLNDLAAAAGGSISRAKILADGECMEFRKSLLRQLASVDPARNSFLQQIMEFIDAAGKEASAKRLRAIWVGDLAIELYQAWLQNAAGAEHPETDPFLKDILAGAPQSGELADRLARCVELTVIAQRKIRANVMPLNAMEIWLRDVGRICRGEPVQESADESLLTIFG